MPAGDSWSPRDPVDRAMTDRVACELDEQRFRARDAALEYLKQNWGERCESFDEHCPLCQAWRAFDVLFGEQPMPSPTFRAGDRVRHPTMEWVGTIAYCVDGTAFVNWDGGVSGEWKGPDLALLTLVSHASTAPTEPGWYWFRADPEHETFFGKLRGVHVALISLHGDGTQRYARFQGFGFETSHLKGDWQRIEPPTWMAERGA